MAVITTTSSIIRNSGGLQSHRNNLNNGSQIGTSLPLFVSEAPVLTFTGKSGLRAVIVIHPNDNVATALKDLEEGVSIQVEVKKRKLEIIPLVPIPFGHKIALQTIQQGADVIKYGEVIGRATQLIEPGQHVHIHNVESKRGRGDLQQTP